MRVGQRAIAFIDERLDLFDQHATVQLRVTASEFAIPCRRVLFDAVLAGIENANDDQGIDFACADQLVSGLVGFPIHAAHIGCFGLEEVLAIVQVEHRIPVGRLGKAEDIARTVLFLVADEADFITGSTLSVNGGQHMY